MIRSTRMSKSMTQSEVALALNISRSTVSMWESGKSLPRADTLLKLAELFECSVDKLLGKEHT